MRILNILKVLIAILMVWLFGGCSGQGKQGWLRDRSEDYVNAQSCRTIQIPKHLQAESFSEEYKISGQ